MHTRLQRWLSPPVFPDEEQTRIAGLLNLLLLALIVSMVLDAVLLLVFAPETLPTFWINGVIVLVGVVLLWITRRGSVRLSSIILCLTLWPLAIYYYSISGGLVSPSLGFLSIFIVIGVTLFGARGAIALGILDTIGIGGLYLAGSRGLLVSVEGVPSLARLFATNSVLFLGLSAFLAISQRSFYQALSRARNGERALEERNRELQNEIAERRQVEAALRASEERYRLLFNGINDAAFVSVLPDSGMPRAFIQVNDVACQRLGYTREELLALTPQAIGAPDKADQLLAIMDRLATTKHVLVETEHVAKDGRTIPVEINAHLVQLNGQPVVLSIARDITERKRTEDALRASEKRYRLISELISDYAYSYSIKADNTIVSDWTTEESFERITGFTVAEIDQRGTFSLYHPDDAPAVERDLDHVLQGQVSNGEYRIITKSGEVRWLRIYRRPVWDAQRSRVESFYGVAQDITERRRADEALAKERNLLRSVIDILPDNIYVKDRAGRFLLNNVVSLRLMGVTRQEEVLGKTDFDFLPRQYADYFYAREQDFYQTGQPVVDREEFQPWMTEHWRWLIASMVPLRDDQGEVIGLIGRTTDITERKRVEEALHKSEEQLQTLFKVLPVGVALLDQEGLLIRANPALETILDTPIETLKGGGYQSWMYSRSDGAPMPLDEFPTMRALAEKQIIHNVEVGIVKEGGATVWTSVSAAPMPPSEIGAVAVIVDITQNKLAEQAQRASDARFSLLVENSPVGIYLVDDSFHFLYANQRLADLIGCPLDELLERDFRSFIAEEDMDRLIDSYMRRRRGGDAANHYEFNAVRKNGEKRRFEVYIATATLPDNKTHSWGQILDVTERKRAEDALRENEGRYRVISEMISDFAFSNRVEANGTWSTEWETDSFMRLTGYSPEEALDQQAKQDFWVFHPDERSHAAADMARLLQGETIDNEYQIVKKDGERRWLHLYRRPVWDETRERVIRYYGVAQDITERKQAEEELQRRDTILEAVSAATNNFLRAADWQEEVVNVLGILGKAAAVERTGIFQLHQDAQGRSVASLRYEWDAPDIPPMLDNPLAQNIDLLELALEPLIERMSLKQPTFFHVKDRPPGKRELGEGTGTKTFSFLPILLHGAIWGALYLSTMREEREWSKAELDALQVASDMLGTVMERKQAEDALQHYTARLNILHRIDRAILAAASPEAIAQAALQQIRQLIPYQSATIEFVDFETSERVLLAVDVEDGATHHAGSRHPLDLRWIETFTTGRTYVVSDVRLAPDTLPVFQNLLDHNARSVAVVPLVAHGKFLGSLDLVANEPDAFTQDSLEIGREVADQLAIAIEHVQLYSLTQRHAAELEQRVTERTVQLEAANEELRGLSRMKDEFVSNVSHELRTPITNLKMRYYLLSKQANRVDLHLPVLQRETDRLARIIEDLLALSRMDQDRTQFNLTAVDLNSLIQQFAADRVPLAESRGLTLNTAFASGSLRVQADAGLLEQVLSVLLTNSLNYTPPGGNVIVSTHMRQVDNQWWAGFSVSDTGPGINREDQDRLFGRFFRGQTGRKSGVSGTGLGLALAKEIVDRHNGQIEVESEGFPGKGTIFTVWLPSV